MNVLNKALDWCVPCLSVILFFAIPSSARVQYQLHKSENPTQDELEAYGLITIAMDSALYYYNKYTALNKFINVYYNTAVPTAEASSNGDLRFGKDRNYMYVGTAMHEMAHTMGMGTTVEYRNMFKDGVFQGENAQTLLKELDGPNVELHGDSQHFWPYGLNYRSEVKSEKDLINHAKIVEAMYQDIFEESLYMKDVQLMAVSSKKCAGITDDNVLQLVDCVDSIRTKMDVYAMGKNTVTYRFQFNLNDRVIDVPNESTAEAVKLGIYDFNGGTHQMYEMKKAEMNDDDDGFFFLLNSKSHLYMMASGTDIIQMGKRSLLSWDYEILYAWKIVSNQSQIDVVDKMPKDTTKTDSIMVIRHPVAGDIRINENSRHFDALGRAANVKRTFMRRYKKQKISQLKNN